uniref:RNA polymerase beta'' subunit n=1 Tax=Thalassionema frauenfeldii TaxID=186022 RepID=UPI001EDC9B3C|nr:RNA polymerase beta'' subunit [Thalassionema frauenfeldii]UHY40512.1 RNA polymerase beta'' subunit [Thalassionema frauenfeldii]UHY40899.1 RNA polymerase beta'' subunit [Thalassionema frauenfeldii]
MKNYTYQNDLIGKKQLRQILGWSFTKYDSMRACSLADELKYLGFKYATNAGISISIEDLRVPFVKNLMLEKANEEIINSEKILLKGKITKVEQFQKIIDTWSLISESLKNQIIRYFKSYDPLNSVYIMAFSGARGNLSQVRQLIGMRGLMSDPSGQIMNLPIKHNFREGLTITDYLMSGYGARKGIVDTALKTANSGYLTRRLIDVAQDIIIREKNCQTTNSIIVLRKNFSRGIIGRVLNKTVRNPNNFEIIAEKNSQITPTLFETLKQKNLSIHLRSPLTCQLHRAICQQCYGWDLSTENLVDIGEAVGIIAGQSIGEPGTQLTMRTFHTGGIFTSEMSQQIVSPVKGIIRFSKSLKTVSLRTNRGEEVLVTKNSGSFLIIPDSITQPINKFELARNTIIFPKHNQYIQKDVVIAELINLDKELKREIKPILSDTSGEVIFPKLKNQLNSLNHNKLLWILSGQLYNSPINSYINFNSNYKINKNSYIFRTKVINSYRGKVQYINFKKDLYQRHIIFKNQFYSLNKINFFQLSKKLGNSHVLVKIKNQKYLLNTQIRNSKIYLKTTRKQKFANLITNIFKTKTGGIIFYDWRILFRTKPSKKKIYFCDHRDSSTVTYQAVCDSEKSIVDFVDQKSLFNRDFSNYFSKVSYRTFFWLEEETHNLKCEPNNLLVKNGDFISKNFKITSGNFSKITGLVLVNQKNNLIQNVLVKSGLIYEGKKIFTKFNHQQNKYKLKKLIFPGEKIFSTVNIVEPCLCELITENSEPQLLIRPLKIYEFSQIQKLTDVFNSSYNIGKNLIIKPNAYFIYQPNQRIQTNKPLNLITKFLYFKTAQFSLKNLTVQIINTNEKKTLKFESNNKLNLNNYLSPSLKYKSLKSSALIQNQQFIDIYTKLVYLEVKSSNPIEIVKIKVNQKKIKQILIISNENCIKVPKHFLSGKTINDFILNTNRLEYIGKIIIESKKFFTIQKGRPHFFPKCKIEILNRQSNIEYNYLPLNKIKNIRNSHTNLSLNYYERFKIKVTSGPIDYYIKDRIRNPLDSRNDSSILSPHVQKALAFKFNFSQLFFKKQGNLYSSLIPRFLKQFIVKSNKRSSSNYSNFFKYSKNVKSKLDRILLLRNYKSSCLTFIKFMEYPFTKSMKSVGLYSITEDLFQQELNSVFCYNNQFLEDGDTIGLLNLEKEITGDIVQGLPRIEEILEARKKNQVIKKLPTSRKNNLLTQITSLDDNFEFHKLGTPLKENEKINPHKLLKIYFYYYGLRKPFFADNQNFVHYARLINNFEGTYKSFKKVQSFILNSVQNVYKSQGVTINDKHIEVIIQQMTTKVLITDEGDTPLLKREVINLYHINSINQIIENEKKQKAYYLPLLFGITRAALNNPSFISAASFQETTRVLTKAAIEGRIDWLRGLKENIITGHSIPAGTGSRNFKNSFKINI